MIKKKKLYCPYCKMIYSTENFREEHSEKICPQCAQNIEDYVQQGKIKKNKEQEREEVENKENNDSIEDSSSAEGAKVAGVSENEPLEIPRDTKKLLVIDLHKIPSVSSRTSDAKKKPQDFFIKEHEKDFRKDRSKDVAEAPESKKDFKEEFLDLQALKKRQMKALEERKKAPNPFKIAKDKEIEPQKEKNKDDLEESAQKISEEQQDPVANQEIPEDQESSKMPENKKELLQKIDRMIFKAKENQAKEKKEENIVLNPLPLPSLKEKERKATNGLQKLPFYKGLTLLLLGFVGLLQWQIFELQGKRLHSALKGESLSTTNSPLLNEEELQKKIQQKIEFPPSLEEQIQEALKKVAPTLVAIRRLSFYEKDQQRITQEEFGSGFFFNRGGYILTNYHVVENGNQIWATLQNNRQIPCELMGSDPLLDLAVLRLDTQEPLELEVVKQGDSSTLFQGQFVFALGAPAGLQNSFTFGVISHKNRYLPTVTFPSSGVSSGSFNTWIQVDTAINHGNSGGPLFNLKGEVIGVNTRTLAQHQNISFALPINAIKDSARTLMSQHQIERAFVGLTLKPISNQKIRGALIEQVLPGSPAETAGIQAQDLLLEVGDHQINVFDESELPLANAILAHLTFNQPHIFLVERQHRRIRSEVTPRQREYFDDQLSTFVSWGFSGIPITQKLREYLGTISADQGIYIMVVEPNSLFARANITSGSVLLAINDQTISSFKDFKEKYDTIIQKKQETSIISIMTTEGLLETRTLQQR